LAIVQPATVVRWHREGFKRFWNRKSRAGRRGGRPALDPELVELIQRMSRSNGTWGAPRIGNELAKLGIEVAASSVAKYMVRERRPPSPTWRAFLDNHVKDLVAIDFFMVPTATFRVLFGFLVLAHDRRRVLHFNVTANPTAEWAARQLVQAFPEETAPRFLIRDRDRNYGDRFRGTAEMLGVEEVVTATRSPWQNAYAERLIGSLRRECLDHLVVLGEMHLLRILASYFEYYNGTRLPRPPVEPGRTQPAGPLDGRGLGGAGLVPAGDGPIVRGPRTQRRVGTTLASTAMLGAAREDDRAGRREPLAAASPTGRHRQ